MAGMLEDKVYYLGCWMRDRVDNAVIGEINSQIQNEKGSKVKLQLSGDGIRVVKNSMIQGKMLHDYVPLNKIQLMTVSQRMPDLLIVISGAREPNYRFQVQVFRCMDVRAAALYIGTFQKLSRQVARPVVVVKGPGHENNDEINWTLRSKQQDNSKRELKKLVDLHGEKAIVHKTNEQNKIVVQNGHSEVFETGVRIPLYRKGKPSRTESTQSSVVDERYDGLDSRSEVSESALRSELENLSQELRDIKLMLEQSTGVTSVSGGSEPGSPRDFKPVDVKVHKHTVVSQPETVTVVSRPETVVYRREEPEVHAVVLDDDGEPVQMRPKTTGGYFVTTSGNTTHVRVSVPDYRTKVEEKVTTNGGVTYTLTKTDVPDTARTDVSRRTAMSYDSWKQDTLRRSAVKQVNDFPERIQWKSRSSRRSHVVSTRPRSAIPSFSSDGERPQMVQVRHHPSGLGPAYQRMSYNPHAVRMHDRKSHSVKGHGLSTTIPRPIEKVYTGHPEAKHHSLVLRSQVGVRPSILVRDGSVRGSQILVMEENNNVVKPEGNDHNLLDVSGLDLYKETPTEVNTTGSAVIRT